MSIGVIVVTFNREKELLKTVDNINKLTESVDIIIVDNNSSDGTEVAIRNLNAHNIHYLRNEENLGSAGGFARGMEYAKDRFEWMWLFNDDSRPHSDSLTSLTQAIEGLNDPNIGLIKIGMLKNGKAESSDWKGRRITKFVPASDKPILTNLITFDGCLIKSEVVETIGTCDPRFFMGIYEFDFCLRAKERGYNIYTLPNGKIEDEKKGSVQGTPYWRMYYVTRNHLFLAIKLKSARTFLAFSLLELKRTFSIIFWQKNKMLKLKYKAMAIVHAISGKMGRRVLPN